LQVVQKNGWMRPVHLIHPAFGHLQPCPHTSLSNFSFFRRLTPPNVKKQISRNFLIKIEYNYRKIKKPFKHNADT